MSELTIWKALKDARLTDAGVAALMGNMQCESALRANNVQDGMGYSDEDYTNGVDSGKISRESFMKDARGYGLCQWTFYTRKAALYDFSKSLGTSIGNEDMQVLFCLNEFPGEAPDTFNLLKTSDDVYKCAEWVCKYYERPAVNNVKDRYDAAMVFYSKYAGKVLEDPSPAPSPGPETGLTVTISREEYNKLTRGYSLLMELYNVLTEIGAET